MADTLAQRLVLARKTRRLTQSQLSELTGMTQGAISNAERGRNTRNMAAGTLAHFLGVNAYWLESGLGDPGFSKIRLPPETRAALRAAKE